MSVVTFCVFEFMYVLNLHALILFQCNYSILVNYDASKRVVFVTFTFFEPKHDRKETYNRDVLCERDLYDASKRVVFVTCCVRRYIL